QDAVLGEERCDHELREETGLHALDQAPRPPSGMLGLAELDRPHQAAAADLAYDVELVDERLRELEQSRAELGAPLDKALLVDLVQRREAGGHRKLVRSERRAV